MSVKTHQTLPLFHKIDLCFYRTKIEDIATDDITHPTFMENFVLVKKLDL